MPGNKTRKIHYISGGNGLAAIFVQNGTQDSLYYAFTDYQGSLIAVTDESGTVKERLAYDPWGLRRNANDWTQTINATTNSWGNHYFSRGYTMHEHLDGFALINMNGRVYDPLVARFLSPDPQLQAPGNWLNYNRYAYCYNNPLIYTDPDGEFIFTAFLIGVAICATIDYGIQVGMNYANGYIGIDAWVNKVDFFDVAVSGAIGGLTAGWGASLKAGETVGKVGMFMVKNAKLVKAGEIVATSAIDITGEGWQDVSFNQFGQRAVTGIATMYASDYISKQFKKSPTQSIEQRVDGAIGTARDNLLNSAENPNLKSAINELYRPGASIGSGSTADALTYEKATGILLSRTGHATKALGYRTNLINYSIQVAYPVQIKK